VRADAGMTLLEVLVVLVILAAVAGVVASSLRPSVRRPADPVTEVTRFLADLRDAAILTGAPAVAEVRSHDIEWGSHHLDLAEASASMGDGPIPASTLIAYPDGTFSGSGFFVIAEGKAVQITGIFRGAVVGPSHD